MNQCTWISLLYFWLQGKYESTAFYELISKVIDLMWKLYIQWKHLQTMKPLCVVSTHFIPSVFAHLIIILFSLFNGGSLIAHLHATQFTTSNNMVVLILLLYGIFCMLEHCYDFVLGPRRNGVGQKGSCNWLIFCFSTASAVQFWEFCRLRLLRKYMYSNK